jgi:hypothetical protein
MNTQQNTHRKHRFAPVRAKQRSEGGKHAPRKRGEHRTIFAAGEVIPESGIYEVVHENAHREAHESVLVKGDPFPFCEVCDARVRFRAVRVAPYIFDDEDFAGD